MGSARRYLEGLILSVRPGSQQAVTRAALQRAAEKGLGPAIRGSIMRWRLAEVDGPLLFIGKAVRLVQPSQLHAGRAVFIGDGSYIDAFSTRGVWLGDRVTLREHSWVQCTSSPERPGVGLFVGESTYFGPGAYLGVGGPIRVGSRCQFGPGIRLIAEAHKFIDGSRPIYGQGVSRSGIEIGDDCWFGANVVVLDGVTVGSGVVVGANSLVTSDLEDRAVAYGSPARIRGHRSP